MSSDELTFPVEDLERCAMKQKTFDIIVDQYLGMALLLFFISLVLWFGKWT